MEQEHERAAGGWQAEWAFVPTAFEATSAAVARTAWALADLRVHQVRMTLNLETTKGLVMAEAVVTALTPELGRAAAQDAVRRACEVAMADSRALVEVLAEDATVAATLHADALRDALDPARYMGASAVFIDHALARHRALE